MGVALGEGLSLDGMLTFVRGERRDSSDDLYRIAPLSGTVVLSYRPTERLGFELASIFAAEQENVSVTNDEGESSRYGILSASVRYELRPGLAVQVGIENILDQGYRQHLAGFNRVVGTDTAVGERFQGGGATRP